MKADPTYLELSLDTDPDASEHASNSDDEEDPFDLENESAGFFTLPPSSPISPMLAQGIRSDIERLTEVQAAAKAKRAPRHQFRDLTGDTDMEVLRLREETKKEKERKRVEREQKKHERELNAALKASLADQAKKKTSAPKKKR